MPRLSSTRLVSCLAFAAAFVATAAGRQGSAQEAPVPLAKLETSPEAEAYKTEVKGGSLSEKSRAFLVGTILPQLAVEANRPTIERTRRLIRERFLAICKNEAVDAANRATLDFAVKLASRPDATALVRINAVLLAGELRDAGGRSWQPAAESLAKMVGDGGLPLDVRVTAAAALKRQVDALRGGAAAGDKPPAAAVAAAVVSAATAAPVGKDRVAGEWIAALALDMLPAVAGKSTPQTAAALVAIIDDAARPVDTRVRAAAALGATVDAAAGIDPSRVTAAIRELALSALRKDTAAAAARAFDRRLDAAAGGRPPDAAVGQPAGVPGVDGAGGEAADVAPLDPLVVRRDAWRLAVLADAILRADGGGGLGSLLAAGGPRDAARFLAETLRTAARDLDAAPTTASVQAAVNALGQTVAPGATPAAPPPAAPGGPPKPGPSPFDAGARGARARAGVTSG